MRRSSTHSPPRLREVAAAPEGVNVPAGLREAIVSALDGLERIAVLEAGCGSATHVGFGRRAVITGIDVSEQQLRRNDRLAWAIVGDIQTYPLDRDSFDVVVCWNVLEHLPRPGAALENLARALRPGGLLVLAIPNAWSLKGWVTRLTPHRFHVWLYRRVLGYDHAGLDEHGPFKTYFRAESRPSGLSAFAAARGLEVVCWLWGEDYAQRLLRRRLHVDGSRSERLIEVVRQATRGRIDVDRTDLFVVLRSRPSS